MPAFAHTTGDIAAVPQASVEEVYSQLEQIKPNDSSVVVDYQVAEGEASTEILQMARKRYCDLIVIGTHGRTGFSRLLAGSVAEQVMRNAPCPVLTVRCPTAHEPAATKKNDANKTENLLLLS